MLSRSVCIPFVLACALAACGSSGGDDAAIADDLATYETLVSQTQAAVGAYRLAMMRPDATHATCATIHDDYDRQIRPWVARMVDMAGPLDGMMNNHGGAPYADMGCDARAMQVELDAHASAACRADLAGDRAEVTRHADAMAGYTGHAIDRCGELQAGLDGLGWGWAPMMDGCHGGMPPGGGIPSTEFAIGQRIFDRGIGIDGEPVPRSGGMGMGGCAMCHGYDGHGRRMMMFTTPNITYANLTDPAGMVEPDGAHGPRYTDSLIQRAVTQGIDPDDETLSTWMPRWRLQTVEWQDLLVYLEALPD